MVIITFTSCKSIEDYNSEITAKHSVSELHEDIDKTYIRLKRAHPKLYQFIAKEALDFKFDSLKKSINKPLTSNEFYYQIAPVVKTIGQGHIYVKPPEIKRTKDEKKALRKMKFNYATFKFESVEDKMFVTSAKDEDSVLIGSEVLYLEEETPQNLIAKYNKNVASDGFNTTLFDRIVASRFNRFYKYDKGLLDSLKVTFKKNDSVFSKTFKWEEKYKKKDSLSEKQIDSLAQIKPIKLSKEKRKKINDSLKLLRKYNKKHGYSYENDIYNRDLKFIGKDSTVALMTIKNFSNGNYKVFYEDTFKTLDSLGTKQLIIDLRDNTGGRVREINNLYGYLTDKEYVMYNPSEVTSRTPLSKSIMSNTNNGFVKTLGVLFSPILVPIQIMKTKKKDGKLYYNLHGVKPLEPAETNFKGDLYVLINGSSFSASSLLSTNLKRDNRAIFIGQETGGAQNGTVAGMTRGYRMPNSKVEIGMGVMQVESPYQEGLTGRGIMPDVEIVPTVADRKAGIDPEIQWVLNNISKKQ